ncbi:hypothetical protein, partial [Evansella tamaricis]|uniref:hypothetical protein n=1 Tax=Evansella tamaricis TaxID=2069301 RepID=UPI00362A48BD
WSKKGLDKFIHLMVALKDRLEVKTLQGRLKQELERQGEEKVNEIIRQNTLWKSLKTVLRKRHVTTCHRKAPCGGIKRLKRNLENFDSWDRRSERRRLLRE